jgi:L-iditol 2-dehydrogenase
MKVAMYYSNNDIRTEDQQKPAISDGEILLRVISSGICGSDVMEWYRIKKAPLVLGHEVAGEVAAVGKSVTAFKKGDRVAVTHHVPCYKCRYCLDGNTTACQTLRTTRFYPGGFAEYLRVPEINVNTGTLLLPKNMSYDEGTFIEPLGCVVRGQRIAGIKKGQTVLVLGSGLAGILHIQLAKAAGAKVIATDMSEFRLDMAKKMGADFVLKASEDVPAAVLMHNENRLADKVIVCTGAAPAVRQALKSVDMGGTILFFAPTAPGVETPVNLEEMWTRCVTLTVSYAADRKDLHEAIELIKSGKVNVKGMITHTLPLEKTGEGFRIVAEAGNSMKVIIRPHSYCEANK